LEMLSMRKMRYQKKNSNRTPGSMFFSEVPKRGP
jgi:hypothetical protein